MLFVRSNPDQVGIVGIPEIWGSGYLIRNAYWVSMKSVLCVEYIALKPPTLNLFPGLTILTSTPPPSCAFTTNTPIIPNANRLLLEPLLYSLENLGHFRPFILPHMLLSIRLLPPSCNPTQFHKLLHLTPLFHIPTFVLLQRRIHLKSISLFHHESPLRSTHPSYPTFASVSSFATPFLYTFTGKQPVRISDISKPSA